MEGFAVAEWSELEFLNCHGAATPFAIFHLPNHRSGSGVWPVLLHAGTRHRGIGTDELCVAPTRRAAARLSPPP